MLSQLPEAERTSCMTAPLTPQRKYLPFTSYVRGWHITHSSRLRNCVGLPPQQTEVQEKKMKNLASTIKDGVFLTKTEEAEGMLASLRL